MSHSRRKVDLTGQQYGSLTALRPSENVGGRTAWLCRCACGREAVIKTKNLRNRNQSTCGACRKNGVAGLTYVDGTCVEMLRTRTVRSNNTSGVPGVTWRAEKNRWTASLCFKGRRHYLGSYRLFEEAVEARQQAEVYYFDNFLREFAGASTVGADADSNID